jgi:predicted ferric reductase
MIIAFFFAVLHTIFISSDISRNNFLKYYILTFVFIGLVVSIRQAFFSKYLPNKIKYKVKNVIQLNRDIKEIEMEVLDKKIYFKPGQFAFFSFIGEKVSPESHPFSISSSNLNDNLKITIKNLGDYTSQLDSIQAGDSVLVDGPYGDFSYKNFDNKSQIWIAGGIGITPFFSMIQNIEKDYKVDLYYSVKEIGEAVYVGDFEEIYK